MRIDLHTHSTASDGTDAPAAVMEAARAAGLDVVALTDHDTTSGWDQAAAAARRLGVALVPGIEISCARRGQSIHLLAFLPDPTSPGLVQELARARESRLTRLDRIVERMAADGIPVTVDQVHRQVPDGATAGRPHIADALVAAGVVSHRDEAFDRWLREGGPYYIGHYAPDPVLGVSLVRAAGGVPVIAHPRSLTRPRVVSDELIEEMADAGLAGLEVYHRDHTPESIAHLEQLSRRLGLLTTGGSDYHGTGKRNLIAENLAPPAALEAIIDQATGVPVVTA